MEYSFIKKGVLFNSELIPSGKHSMVDLNLRYDNRIRVKNAPKSCTSYSPGYIKEVDGTTVMIITLLDVLDTAIINL